MLGWDEVSGLSGSCGMCFTSYTTSLIHHKIDIIGHIALSELTVSFNGLTSTLILMNLMPPLYVALIDFLLA